MSVNAAKSSDQSAVLQPAEPQVTNNGRVICRPARYLNLSAPMGQPQKKAEDIKTREQRGSHENDWQAEKCEHEAIRTK